jgi:hypothetical protein
MLAELMHVYKHQGKAAAHQYVVKHQQRVVELIGGSSSQPERGNTMIGPLARSAARGDLDKAFELLQRALEVRDPVLVHLAVAPQWDSLRADPRFNECLARMKLRLVGTVSGPMPESR